MSIHIRTIFVIHIFLLVIGVTRLLSQTHSLSIETLTLIFLCGWMTLVVYGIWSKIRLTQYALWINGLLILGSALFAILAMVYLGYSQQEATLPGIILLIQVTLGAYLIFAVRSEDTRSHFGAE